VSRIPDLVHLLAPLGAVAPVLDFAHRAYDGSACGRRRGHTIIVAGGDGTVHHVVNALASVPSTIGILPSGPEMTSPARWGCRSTWGPRLRVWPRVARGVWIWPR
jgi:hypothetical protein